MKSRAELSRRELLHTALAAPVASLALGAESLAASLPAEAQAAHAAAHLHTPLYERLGVKTSSTPTARSPRSAAR